MKLDFRTTLFAAVLASAVLAISLTAVDTANRQAFTAHGDAIIARDLAAAVAMSDVIVLGTVTAAGGTRNIARDAKDPSQPDRNLTVTAQDYAFAVDTVIKGSTGSGDIIVTSARTGFVKHGARTGEWTYDNFVPLAIGTRYALLLRAVTGTPGVYATAFEPSRFELGDAANIRSTSPQARQLFPPLSTPVFVQTLRTAVGVGR